MRSIVSVVLALSFGACDPDAQRSAGSVVGARTEEGGVHRRVATAHGPLHVWTPRHSSESGDIVVYVHADIDRAWQDDQLAAQFAASGLDAMFIASGPSWGSLAEVLGTAQLQTTLALPAGKVIVVGRSPVSWLAESQLDRVVILDVVDVARYGEWLEARADRQLIVVGGAAARLPAARAVYVKAAALPVLLQMAAANPTTPIAQM